jgi:hypothetical protein
MLNNKGVSVLLENCKLKAFKNQGLLFKGTAKGGLYYVNRPEKHAFKTDSTPPKPYSHDKCALWHARTSHANYKYVDKLLKCAEGVQFIKPKPKDLPASETACKACLAGRIKELFNKTTDNREQLKVQRLHTNISGIKSHSTQGY